MKNTSDQEKIEAYNNLRSINRAAVAKYRDKNKLVNLTVTISAETKEELKNFLEPGETWSQCFQRIINILKNNANNY